MTTQQIDYWTGKPRPVSNRNVPKDAEIIGQVSYCSGEIIYTYYCQRYEPAHPDHGGWAFWKVADWVSSQPAHTNMEEMKSLDLIPKGYDNVP